MSWHTTLVTLVRPLIADTGPTYEYDDGKIEEIAITAAQIMLTECYFSTTYTINVLTQEISPDPLSDSSFMVLMALKTACLFLLGETKRLAKSSYSISDGLSKLDVKGAYQATKEMYDDAESKYRRGIIMHQSGNGYAITNLLPLEGREAGDQF